MRKQFKREYVISEIQNSISNLTDEKFNLNTNIKELLDSLDVVTIMMNIEEIFNIKIEDDDIDNLMSQKTVTILDIIEFLKIYDIFDIKEIRKDKLDNICLNYTKK